MLIASYGYVIVRVELPADSITGSSEGIVIDSCCDDEYSCDTDFEPGTKVYFAPLGTFEISYAGEKLLVVRGTNIIAYESIDEVEEEQPEEVERLEFS